MIFTFGVCVCYLEPKFYHCLVSLSTGLGTTNLNIVISYAAMMIIFYLFLVANQMLCLCIFKIKIDETTMPWDVHLILSIFNTTEKKD